LGVVEMRSTELITKVCKYCGKSFLTASKQRQCCSKGCSYLQGAKVTKERGKNFKRIYSVYDSFLDEETPEKYYYLGLMSSDGNVSKSTISINQSNSHGKELISWLRQILKSDSVIYESKNKYNSVISYTLAFRSEKIINTLRQNNIVEGKTFSFSIPSYILEDEEKLRNFLIGYIDGDGCIGVYNTFVIEFVCNENVMEQLKKLDKFKGFKIRKIKHSKVYEFRSNGIKGCDFCSWLYKDIKVFKSTKYQKFIDYYNNVYINQIDIIEERRRRQASIFKAFDDNPNLNCMIYARENGYSFQHIYEQREKWRKENGI